MICDFGFEIADLKAKKSQSIFPLMEGVRGRKLFKLDSRGDEPQYE